MKIVCLLHALLKEIQEWTGGSGPTAFLIFADRSGSLRQDTWLVMLHLLGLRAGALVRDLRRAFTLAGFETS